MTLDGEAPRLLDLQQRRRMAADPGLCDHCRHAAVADSGYSVFMRCTLAQRDPRFPSYPRLPVLACSGYGPRLPKVDE